MNVIVVMSSLTCGGAEKSLISFLNALEERYKEQISVDLLVFRPEGLFLNQIPESVNMLETPKEVYCMSYSPLNSMFWKGASIKGLLGKCSHYLQSIIRYKNNELSSIQKMWLHWKNYIPSVLKEYDVAISYMHGATNYFVIDKCKAKKKYVYIHHEYEKMDDNWEYDYDYFSKADAVITVSEKCVQSVLNVHPDLKGKVISIENIHPVALIKRMASEEKAAEFCHAQDIIKIVSIGRLTGVKRFDRAIDAAKILKEKGLRFLWVLIGSGELEEKLKKMVKDLSLEDVFIFVGQKSNPYPYILAADIFVQTSDNEGKSMVIDEAKILKKPIVVTNYMTVRDVVEHRVNGLIADFTPESVAEAIYEIAVIPGLKEHIIYNLGLEEMGNEDEIEKFINLWRK